jgi:hypothetical protein
LARENDQSLAAWLRALVVLVRVSADMTAQTPKDSELLDLTKAPLAAVTVPERFRQPGNRCQLTTWRLRARRGEIWI